MKIENSGKLSERKMLGLFKCVNLKDRFIYLFFISLFCKGNIFMYSVEIISDRTVEVFLCNKS